jgi:uncharacterized protein (DUF305 family)
LTSWRLCCALGLVAASAMAQTPAQPVEPAPIVQPGAPGQSSKTLSPDKVRITVNAPAPADVSFMQGMIMHHGQAVEMTDLLKTRSRNPELRSLAERISISQTDEMKYMQQWLEDRKQPVTMNHMADMKGMDHSKMKMEMPLMPGMLTPEQMKALAEASGPQFDHLFLTGMIQHHGGALVMVDELLNTAGAGQDAVLFDFATDIDNTQQAEIRIMQAMLLKEKK